MIKVGLDAGDYSPGSRVENGIQRIVASFLKEISNTKNKNFFFDYYYFDNKNNSLRRSNFSFNKLPRRFFASFFLPLNIIKNKDHVFLALSGHIPFWLQFAPVKKILFIYDLGFIKYPQFYPNWKRLTKQTVRSIDLADKIIVLSDYVRADLLRMFPCLKSKKIIRIYSGIDHIKKVKPAKIKRELGPYLLYVGVIKPSKNIAGLIKYFAQLPDKTLKLVLIGKKEKDYYREIITSSDCQLVKNRLLFLEGVSDQELTAYYRDAQEVLNFSQEEGFCYPVLEALALGKKTTTNDLPLYQEFKKYFKTPGIPEIFTWKHFTRQLLAIIRQ